MACEHDELKKLDGIYPPTKYKEYHDIWSCFETAHLTHLNQLASFLFFSDGSYNVGGMYEVVQMTTLPMLIVAKIALGIHIDLLSFCTNEEARAKSQADYADLHGLWAGIGTLQNEQAIALENVQRKQQELQIATDKLQEIQRSINFKLAASVNGLGAFYLQQ